MPVTSLHKPTNRWLTSFGDNARPGDVLTWSVGHPLSGGEFTTIRLGAVVAHSERGEPLFDDLETDVLIEGSSGPDAAEECRVWATRAEIKAAKEAAGWGRQLQLKGRSYERTGFGNWREVAP